MHSSWKSVINVQKTTPTTDLGYPLSHGKGGGGEGVSQKKPKMEHDGDKGMNVWEKETDSEKRGHDRDAGSSADGAVAVSLKFHLVHLEHLRTCLARFDRRVGLLRVQ